MLILCHWAGVGLVQTLSELQRVRIARIPEEDAFGLYFHQALVLQLFHMMRECGSGSAKLSNDVDYHHTVWMRREQQPHDTQTRFCNHVNLLAWICCNVMRSNRLRCFAHELTSISVRKVPGCSRFSSRHRHLPLVVAGFSGFLVTILDAVVERRSFTE
jgi:hypothetical protein